MATSEYLKDTEKRGSFRKPEEQKLRGKSIAGVSHTAPALRMLKDGILIAISVAAAIVIRYILVANFSSYWGNSLGLSLRAGDFLYFGWFTFCYILVARRYGLYAPVPLRNGAHETRLIAQAVFTAMLFLCGALFMMHNIALSRLLVLIFVVVAAVALSIQRATWRRARYRDYEQGIELRNVLVLGTNRLSVALGEQMAKRTHMGRHLCGYIRLPGSEEEPEVPRERVLGGIGDLRQIVRGRFVDELVIAQPCSTEMAIRLVEEARTLDIDLSSITGYFSDLSANAPHERIGYYPIVMLHRRERRVLSLVMKRIVDIAFSLLAIVLILPAMAVVALAILLEGAGPIFYVSERIGKRGRYFKCFKFRTMVPDAEKRRKEIAKLNERDGILFKASNDPRITPLGKFLRKYSLDELPQFFNVLRGEMSLVGPRPPLESEVERYELDHLRRLDVLPGLTGLWQIQARQNSSFDRYIALDTAYIENWSFWLDLTILIRTVGVVLRGTGI
jgi:exopolysaccharide biosynthesis polyprenyl glycosylphosphotransferase